ncbi:non-ribosomal peptide synthetase [Neorhodopirellula lusitana]|nr:non-ribosomal peptide synthetase [Neorhodopirellula lusitana]
MEYEITTNRTSDNHETSGMRSPVHVDVSSAPLHSASVPSQLLGQVEREARSILGPDSRVAKMDRGNYSAIQLPTLVEYCLHYAQNEVADQPAFTHVTGQPGTHQRLTFKQLDRRARAIAAEIQKRGGSGHPVLVVQEPGVDYAASLFGCLYARAIAVPVYPPQMLRLQQTLPRLQAMIANAGAKCMLSSRSIIGDSLLPLWSMSNEMAIAVDEVQLDAADDWDGVLPKADDVAVLQYTSGSTGNPRGVVLSHRVLLSNLNAVIEHYHFEGANSVQWVPPYHDMGLIGGIFVPIFRGVETVVISPVDFVRDPLLWLKCIDYYDGSSNGSPNFGYELCVRRISDADCEAAGLDLSSWKVAIAGAEPVRAATLRRFTDKFAKFGFAPESFCPAFGMAETTVVATGTPLESRFRSFIVDSAKLQSGLVETIAESDKSDAVNTLELVSSGVPVDSMSFEIVDPQTCARVPDGHVGEVWIRGSSVALGYWNDEEATERTFHAEIRDEERQDVEKRQQGENPLKYLRTGDLGTRIDGELIVTGRLKELIIVAGRNLYPHDVEEVVQSVSEAFRPDSGTAFSMDTGDSEELVIVQELWRPKKFLANELLPEIVAAVLDQTHVTPHTVVLVRSGSLHKTSSGKLRRTDTKNAFLAGELTELARWEASGVTQQDSQDFASPASPTEQRVAKIWSRLLNVDPIGRQDDFFHLGGGSLLVGEMLTEIAQEFEAELSITTAFRHSTLADFAQVIDSESDIAKPLVSIPQTTIQPDATYPLSHAQRRFWLLDQLGQTDAFVYVPVSIELAGRLEVETLQVAIDALVRKHPMLRTQIVEQNGEVWQTIASPDEKSTRVMIRTEASDDANENDLFQVTLVQENDQTSRIDLRFHHMICDASSVEILLADLQAIMDSEPSSADVTSGIESPEAISYVDYATWDQSEPRAAMLPAGEQYWRERLEGVSQEFQLPRDESPRQELLSQESSTSGTPQAFNAWVPHDLGKRIERLATEHGLTASMIYLTVFQSVLARYGDSDDFAITVPTSYRPVTGLNRAVGCFVNPITYRATVKPQASLLDSMLESRDRLLADLDHADVPFQRILASVEITRTGLRMPLSQVMFLYQPAMKTLKRLGAIPVQKVKADYSDVTAYDLSLVVEPSQQPQAGPSQQTELDQQTELQQQTGLTLIAGRSIDHAIAQQILTDLQTSLQQIADQPDCGWPVSDLAVTLPAPSGDSGQSTADLEMLVARLTQHAAHRPDAIAITDDQTSLSYAELNALTDRIAAALIHQGVQPGDLVAIELPRSVDLMVAILGVWKSRAGYVPLTVSMPGQRRQQILDDARPRLVIDSTKWASLQDDASNAIELNTYEPNVSQSNTDDLAYVMYTSGSTGVPKGVAIEQGSVANLLASFAETPGFTADDTMLAVTTVTFDISVLEMFLPIWCGGGVRITDHQISDAPEAVAELIEGSGCTHVQSTPSAFRMLLSTGWRPCPNLTLLCGGEPLMKDLASELLSTNHSLWNVYGPTETTVWSTVQRISTAEEITIGKPIRQTECRVWDRNGLETPVGVPGELLIGGLGVARGYFGNDEQTAERFVEAGGDRFYRTGDQVRLRPDGQYEFLARNDRQVKIRGFRVELDEIEAAIQQCDGVQRAAVVLRQNGLGYDNIVAYCGTSDRRDSDPLTAELLKQDLSDRLPDYMIPTTIHFMDQLPQTPAGKTDYKSLPTSSAVEVPVANEPPQTPIEKTLAEAWCEILERDSVGRHDHFFDLGGNSLMAAQLFARLRERFQVQLQLSEIYQRPTICALAEAIVQNQASTQADELTDLLSQLDSLSDDEALKALEQDS